MLPTLLLALAAAPAQHPAVPTAEAVVNALRDCPPAFDPAPFLRTPKLDLIGPCRDTAADHAPSADAWAHVFHRAARFTQPRFGLCREPLESDGLLIYEGMRLTVDPATGVYDLAFVATAPPTPVTVRLQLHFARTDAYAGPGSAYDPIRLTLPPITIDADPAAKPGDSYGVTLRVHHRGYSELFLKAKAQRSASSDLFPDFRNAKVPTIDKSGWQIIRTGTARFGSGLPNADEPGR